MVKGGDHANGHLISMPATENIPMALKGQVPVRSVIGVPGDFAEIAGECLIPPPRIGWAGCWLGTAR